MPPRAVRRSSTATATSLKKKPPAKTRGATKVKTKDAEAVQHINPNTEEHQGPLPPPKASEENKEKEFVSVGYHEVDRSERLELEDNDPHSEAEDDGVANIEMGEHRDEMEGEGEEHDEERIREDEMMMEVEEEEEEEDGDDGGGVNEFGVEVDGDEEEHHDLVKERRKRKEFEIFVGGLDRDATEEDLRKVFCQVGDITEVRLMKNPLTQKNKGFAFLRFATVEQARRALNELKYPTVNGKQCGVSPSQDSDTLFVGNICKTWTKEVLKEQLALYGVDNFEDLTLVEDTRNERMNRGFAFLDFSSRSDALNACKRLQKRDVVFGTDRTAKVAFADTFIEPDDEIMSQVKTIFLDGLPASWDEDRVKEHLKKFGNIEKVELARNMPAAKRTDFGFVTFDTHNAAVACVESVNHTELGDIDKKAKVRARLSRPRQRGKSAKHARGGYLVRRGGGRAGKTPWDLGMPPQMDSWRFAGRNGGGIQSHGTYSGGYRRAIGSRERNPVMNVVLERVGSRRQLPSLERSFDHRSPVSAYGKSSSKRDYVRYDEPIPRSSGYARVSMERHSSYRDAYASRGSGYIDSQPRSASRRAPGPPLYAEESYGRQMERASSYHKSHSRDYDSISGSKRLHSAMEELHPRYAESTVRQSRARFDYDGSSAALPYGDTAYGSESTRTGRSSHVEYEGGSRSSAGHYDTHTTNMGYSKDEVSRGDSGGTYSGYSRDYMSTGADMGGSYSSLYSRRRMNDGYLSGRGSGSYY